MKVGSSIIAVVSLSLAAMTSHAETNPAATTITPVPNSTSTSTSNTTTNTTTNSASSPSLPAPSLTAPTAPAASSTSTTTTTPAATTTPVAKSSTSTSTTTTAPAAMTPATTTPATSTSTSTTTPAASTTTLANAPDISGNYRCEGNDASGKSPYASPAVVNKNGDTFSFQWLNANGYPYNLGTGIYNKNSSNMLAVVFWDPKKPDQFGTLIYQVQNDGSLSGNWVYQGSNQVGSETCTKTK